MSASGVIPSLPEYATVLSPAAPTYATTVDTIPRNDVAVLTKRYVDTYSTISLADGLPHSVVSVAVAAQPVDCIAVFKVVSALTVDAAAEIESWGLLEDGGTPSQTVHITSYIADTATTGGNRALVTAQGITASIPAGRVFTLSIYYKLNGTSAVSVSSSSLNVIVSPAPVLV